MAIGVAAISRFMTPKPSAPATAATMNTGRRASTASGRAALRRGTAASGGNSMNCISASDSSATAARDR